MPDEGAVAVAEPVEQPLSGPDISAGKSEPSTGDGDGQRAEKHDGRKQPDALRKRISELRRQADSIDDPAEKARLLQDAKELNNRVGKVSAYEQTFPTVREAREVKALVESFGGREGLANLQETLSTVQSVDEALEAGDPSVVERMWQEAPQGMVRLAPIIFSELEKANPQEYQKAVVPHAVKFFDASGFPEAFDQMVQLFSEDKKEQASALAVRLAQWFASQRKGVETETKRTDPEVERLRRELEERGNQESQQAVDAAYREVVSHAGPVIDRYLRPIVAKLGLSRDQYNALREDTWKYLQESRNSDPTYQTVAKARQKQGMKAVAEYVKSETESRAQEAARKRANAWYGHQLKNGAVKSASITKSPVAAGMTRGKEPAPSEIDYSAKGVAALKKAGAWKPGYKDMADAILDGIAPLKAGGIRKWR